MSKERRGEHRTMWCGHVLFSKKSEAKPRTCARDLLHFRKRGAKQSKAKQSPEHGLGVLFLENAQIFECVMKKKKKTRLESREAFIRLRDALVWETAEKDHAPCLCGFWTCFGSLGNFRKASKAQSWSSYSSDFEQDDEGCRDIFQGRLMSDVVSRRYTHDLWKLDRGGKDMKSS
jgi:hypothetical protein